MHAVLDDAAVIDDCAAVDDAAFADLHAGIDHRVRQNGRPLPYRRRRADVGRRVDQSQQRAALLRQPAQPIQAGLVVPERRVKHRICVQIFQIVRALARDVRRGAVIVQKDDRRKLPRLGREVGHRPPIAARAEDHETLHSFTFSKNVSGRCGSKASFAHMTVTRFSVSLKLMILWV